MSLPNFVLRSQLKALLGYLHKKPHTIKTGPDSHSRKRIIYRSG